MATINTHYLAKFGAEDAYIDSAAHDVPVSASVTRSVTGLAAHFHRIDGTGTTGTGDWLTTGKMTASYFVAVHASTPSVFPVATVSTTLNVVDASTFQVDATSLDCAVAANFTAKITGTAGGEINTLTVGTPPAGSEALRAATARLGTTVLTDSLSVTGVSTFTGAAAFNGAVSCASTFAVTGSSTLTGAVALNGGATVPSGQTLTVASGGTLSVAGTFSITTLAATGTATIANATGGSEALRTTTFRATGASALVGAVTVTGATTLNGNLTAAAQADFAAETNMAATGQFNVLGVANLLTVPDASDTSTSGSLDLDALNTPNSHQFGPTGTRTITSVSGTYSGVFWFINAHGSNAVTIATGYMNLPAGTFTLAAGERALLYWDKLTTKFTVISHD